MKRTGTKFNSFKPYGRISKYKHEIVKNRISSVSVKKIKSQRNNNFVIRVKNSLQKKGNFSKKFLNFSLTLKNLVKVNIIFKTKLILYIIRL